MLFGKLFTSPKMWVNGDADEITMGGVYTCKDVQNVPTGDGALLVFKTENTVKQVFVPVGEEGVVYTRVLGEEWTSVTGTSEETEALIQNAIGKANQAQAKADTVDTRLNNIILESGTSDAEVVAARTDSNGQTFTTLGVRLDTQFGEIKEDLSAYNSINLLKRFATYTNRTSGGVTYTWDASANTCHAVGTSNALSFTNLYVGAILPIGIKIGDKIWVKALSTKAFNLFLEIMAYNGSTYLSNGIFRESGYYTVPENTTALNIRVRTRYVTGEPSTVDDYITVEILNTKSNMELSDELNNIPLNLIQVFPKYTTIGDSLMCGFVNNDAVSVSSADAKLAGNNWPTYIAKRTGLEFTNVAVGGSTTAEWRATHIATANVDTNCYIIGLGINDLRQSLSVGTSADIKSDYTANADSFYGNYDYIVRQLMSWKSNAHIMCFAIPSIEPGNTDVYNSAIKYIASRYANKVHFVDLTEYANEYNNKLIVNNFVNGHFNPIAYNMMSGIIERAINTYIYNNYTIFLGAPYV